MSCGNLDCEICKAEHEYGVNPIKPVTFDAETGLEALERLDETRQTDVSWQTLMPVSIEVSAGDLVYASVNNEATIKKNLATFVSQEIKLDGAVQEITITATVDLRPKCDCGAEKCKTTHADWCSSRGVS